MRFCLPKLLFAARCCSISAIAFWTLLGTAVEAAQVNNGYAAPTFSGYGTFAETPVTQNPKMQAFSTSRPWQADPIGNDYQSMSPDSWGRPAANAAVPFSSPVPASTLGNNGTTRYPLSTPTLQHSPAAPSHGFYGAAPKTNATGQPPLQPSSDQFAPDYQYESTGAASVRDLLGSQGTPQSSLSNRVAPTSPFQRAQFDAQDPRDIPLAPTVPSSIMDANDHRLDLPSPAIKPNAQNPVAPSRVELAPSEPQLRPPVAPQWQPPVTPQLVPPVNENVSPQGPQTLGSSVQGNLKIPANSLPPSDQQTFDQSNNLPQTSPEIQYPRTTAPPIAPLVQAPQAPYQMPQVFQAGPANATVLTPTTVVPQTEFGTGFGWGNAPGIFRQRTQPSPAPQPQPILEHQHGTGPSFPLPFGMGSKLFGKRSKQASQHNAQPDFSQLTDAHVKEKRSLFGSKKQVDPNTYPPQPISHSQPDAAARGSFPIQPPTAIFRPDLGQRAPFPTVRNPGTYDSGYTEYDFENKKREFPPFSEILATGRYFASIEGQFVKLRFNGTSGIAILDQSGATNSTDSTVFDFDYEFIPNFRFGFESKYGPGAEFDYRMIRTASVVQSFTSGAATSASLRSVLPDVSLSSVISTTAPGQTISGAQTFNLEEYGFSVFKEVQLPVTRLNGQFGFKAVDIDHQVDATVVDAAGTSLQSLNSRSDMRALGPRIRLDYFRPVGHTRLEFLTQAGGSVLFGKRDQRILGQGVDSFRRIGTDEIVTTFEFLTALQIKQRIGENRSVFGRIGYLNQAFNGGGSGFLTNDDFGLRGITFLLGINR